MFYTFLLFLVLTFTPANERISSLPFSWQESPPAISINSVELETGVRHYTDKVKVFQVIREVARSTQVKVALTGDTAESFANYVYWYLRKQKGDRRVLESKMDFHFANIFPYQRDLKFELEVQGAPGSQKKFLEMVQDRFRFLKIQASSHSQKQVPINFHEPMRPHFLDEITQRKIKQTLFFEGKSFYQKLTDALSLMRSASKFEYSLSPEIKSQLVQVFQSIPSNTSSLTEAEMIEVQRLGLKIFFESSNLENSFRLLEEVDPQKNLAIPLPGALQSKYDMKYALETWRNKIPLKASPPKKKSFSQWIRFPRNKTAQDLGLNILAHGTPEMEAYYNMTRSLVGRPNVFMTRPLPYFLKGSSVNKFGERGVRGDGFYTRKGKDVIFSAIHSPYFVNFRIDPNARLGVDFTVFSDEVLIKNLSVLSLVEETDAERLTGVDYFQAILKDPSIFDDEGRLLHRGKYRTWIDLAADSVKREEVENLARSYFEKIDFISMDPNFLKEYLSLPETEEAKKTLDILADKVKALATHYRSDGRLDRQLRLWVAGPASHQYPDIIEALLNNPNYVKRTSLQLFMGTDHLNSSQFWKIADRSPYKKEIREYYSRLLVQGRFSCPAQFRMLRKTMR